MYTLKFQCCLLSLMVKKTYIEHLLCARHLLPPENFGQLYLIYPIILTEYEACHFPKLCACVDVYVFT